MWHKMYWMLILILNSNFCSTGSVIADKQYASMPLLFHLDNFDKCMLLEDEALYCSFVYELEPLNSMNASETWKIIKEVSADKYNYRHDHLRHWICVPFTCPVVQINTDKDSLQKGITDCYNEKYQHLGLKGTINNLKCETNEPKYPVDFLDITVAIIFICIICFVLFASFYEGLSRYKPVHEYEARTNTYWGRILAAFSIPKNWYNLKTVRSTPEVEKLRSLQGIRFYNTILVIFSHSAFTFMVGPVVNTKYPETINQKIANLFLSSGPLCVSTFFLMSSFLLVNGILSHFENKKMNPKQLVEVFVSRYLRLLPILVTVIAFQATWWRHLGRGPNWNNIVGKEYLQCRKNWWTNLLFINNWVDVTNMCLCVTWYLALDTQYFIILLIVIWFIKKYPKLVWPLLASLLVLNIICTFIEHYIHNFEALVIPLPEILYDMRNIVKNPRWHVQLCSKISNTAGSIVGLFYGYLYYKNKNETIPKSKEKLHQVLFHIIMFGGSFGIILIPGWYVFIYQAQHDRFWASCYVALSRPIFSTAIGYGTYRMTQGLGWLSKYVVEWPPTYILGRLSYCAYLCHITLMFSRPAAARYPIHVTDESIIYYLLGDLTSTYIVALLLTLFIEMPFCALQKLLIVKSDQNGKAKKEE